MLQDVKTTRQLLPPCCSGDAGTRLYVVGKDHRRNDCESKSHIRNHVIWN